MIDETVPNEAGGERAAAAAGAKNPQAPRA